MNQPVHKGIQHLHVSKQAMKISEIRLHYLGYKHKTQWKKIYKFEWIEQIQSFTGIQTSTPDNFKHFLYTPVKFPQSNTRAFHNDIFPSENSPTSSPPPWKIDEKTPTTDIQPWCPFVRAPLRRLGGWMFNSLKSTAVKHYTSLLSSGYLWCLCVLLWFSVKDRLCDVGRGRLPGRQHWR